MEYDTIEVDIGPGNGRDYPITVRSPAGEVQATMRFPVDELTLENRLLHLQNALLRSGGQRRQVLSPEQETVQRFGQEVFDALMTGEVRLFYERSEDRAQWEGKGLRIQLRIQPPEIATLPWEFMYDSYHSTYLALSPRTPVIRYLNLPRSIDPLKIRPPLRILGMIANPQGVQRLDSHREKERLERAIAPFHQSGLIELTWVSGETWRDLQRAMRSDRWHIFHFIGHGGFDKLTDEGFIVLSNEQQQPHFLPATQLAELLISYYSPRLVLLNACDGAQGGKQDIFSSTASILIRRGIPTVVAMQYEITDQAAIEFSHSFYDAISTGVSVEAAMANARQAIWISIPNSFEWGTPVLYTHAPDGILFDIQNQDDEQIMPQSVILSSEREAETPGELVTGLTEQKLPQIEEESPVLESYPKGAKQDQNVLERIQVAQLQSSSSFNSPTSAPINTVVKRTFYRQWVLANVMGWIVVTVATVIVAIAIGKHVRWDTVAIGSVEGDWRWVVGVGWSVVGFTQWFVLRQYISRAHWWIWATIVSAIIGGSIVRIVGQAIGGEMDVRIVMGIVAGGTLVGFAQWLILRQYISQAHRWLWASTLGWIMGMIMFILISVDVIGDEVTVRGVIAAIVSGIAAGATYATVTVFTLFGLLQPPMTSTDSSSTFKEASTRVAYEADQSLEFLKKQITELNGTQVLRFQFRNRSDYMLKIISAHLVFLVDVPLKFVDINRNSKPRQNGSLHCTLLFNNGFGSAVLEPDQMADLNLSIKRHLQEDEIAKVTSMRLGHIEFRCFFHDTEIYFHKEV